jgi:hypothetical protein
MDPTRASRLQRRDHGMRRQRRVTLLVVAVAVAVAAAFGWLFAHPSDSSALSNTSVTQSTIPSSES